MNLKVTRYAIFISPDNETDEAFIEEVLGLRKTGDSVKLVRRNAFGLSCLGNLEAKKEEVAKSESEHLGSR